MQRNPIGKQRNYGIDLLRLVGAFYVIILHTIYQGGIYYCVAPGSVQQKVCQFLLSFSYCSVNIFGLISGYTGYSDQEKGYNFPSYILLWLQVASYNVGIRLVCRLLFPDVFLNSMLHILTPVIHNTYWYFTAYTLLFFFMPLLNNAIRVCKKETLVLFLLFLLFFFSPYEAFYGYFLSYQGYSFLWLMVLYLIGATLKKLQLEQKVPTLFLFVGILLLTALTYACYPLLTQLQQYSQRLTPGVLMSYTFPFYLYSSILYTLLFAKLPFKKWMQRLISFAGPAAFSVYIVNVHPVAWAWLKDRFCNWVDYSTPSLMIHILVFSALFVAAVVVADYIRRKVFGMLRIKQFLEKAFSKITAA